MGRAADARERVRQFMAEQALPLDPLPLYMQVLEWTAFAEIYLSAARALETGAELEHLYPKTQITGHAIECALKACIAAHGATVPQIHDLVDLADRVLELGIKLSDIDLTCIVNLNREYYRDPVTATKFKARYPAEDGGFRFRPPPVMLAGEVVRNLLDHAKRENDARNRLASP